MILKTANFVQQVRIALGCSVAASAMLVSGAAWGQTTGPAEENSSETEASAQEIVVTGTQIRGIAPAGTNTVNVSRENILASGTSSASDLLARIPQITNSFNQVPTIPTFGVARTIVRPNIRNIATGTGGSSTLVLIDGHRAVGAGTLENTPDIEVIPSAVLERVDVIPDGGSSIYGSDAVGGVINFITRRRFDGVEAAGHIGFADNYQAVDFNLTGGKDWGSGSAYISYAYAHNDAIFGRDRGYVQQVSPSPGSCAPGTVSINRAGVTTNYALPGRVASTTSSCDFTDNFSFIPRQTRHSVFAGLMQEIAEGVEFDFRTYYTRRETIRYNDLNQAGNLFATAPQSGTITASNPYYVPINDPVNGADTGVQSVQFSYAGVFDSRGIITLDEYGFTPSIKAELGKGWQLRVLGNYGRTKIDSSTPAIDSAAQSAALAGTTLATALNPYDLSATNPAVLSSINRSLTSPATQELVNARAIVDGPLAELPGGDVRMAAGVEYYRETYTISQDTYAPGVLSPVVSSVGRGRRHVTSAFGELSIPIVGDGNASAGIQSLLLSLSGRYDHYSDFGSTFNPKVGLTYRPADWLSIRGNWGKSYNAPGLADSAGIRTAQLFNISPFRAAGSPFFFDFFRPTILLAGSNPDLRPQTARTWSVGFDADLPIADGLRASATYYHISMHDLIGTIPFFAPAAYTAPYAAFVTPNPTIAQATAATAGYQLTGNFPSIAAVYGAGTPYVLMDARQNNLGDLKQSGLDYNLGYNHDTSFGSVNASLSGTYILSRKASPVAGQTLTDQLATPGSSRFSMVAGLGATIGNFTASANLYHSGGYDLLPNLVSAKYGVQDHVKSFNTVNLLLQYSANGEGLAKDLTFTLNANNLFDQDPPFFNQDNGYTNGSTLGRFVQLGVRKKF